MNKLTRYRCDIKEYDYIKLTGGIGEACINKLGKIEDLMEKYEIEDLVELEKALDQYYHRYDKVETRRVDNIDTVEEIKVLIAKANAYDTISKQLYNVPLEFILKHEHKQVYWNNAYHDVRNIVPYEEHTEPYVEIFVREKNKVVVKTLWFKDYGKTWWLKGENGNEED